jgi:hypothetical protein
MKLCKNCFWRERSFPSLMEFVKCRHPNYLDPVTGKGQNYCSTMRKYGDLCGLEAKLWKNRRP